MVFIFIVRQYIDFLYDFVKLLDLCMACEIKLLFDDNGAGIFDPDDAIAPLTGGVVDGFGDDVEGDPVPLGFLFIRMDE